MCSKLITHSIIADFKYCRIDFSCLLLVPYFFYAHGNQCCQEYGLRGRPERLILTALITMYSFGTRQTLIKIIRN